MSVAGAATAGLSMDDAGANRPAGMPARPPGAEREAAEREERVAAGTLTELEAGGGGGAFICATIFRKSSSAARTILAAVVLAW